MYGAIDAFDIKEGVSVGIGVSEGVDDVIGGAVGIIMIKVNNGDIIPVIDGFIFGYARIEDGDHALKINEVSGAAPHVMYMWLPFEGIFVVHFFGEGSAGDEL